MAKSFASYTLHVSTLSPSTGQVIISANILSNIVDPLTHFAVLTRPNTTQPQALWIEQETLRFVGLTPTLKEKGRQLKGTGYTRIRDIGLNDQGHAVISRKEGSSFVLKFDEVNSAKSAWEFVDSVSFFFCFSKIPLIIPVGLFLRYRLGKVQTLFTLEYWIGLGIHMSHGSVGRINWRYASFFYYGILFIPIIIIGAERFRRRFCWTLGRRIRVFIRVCVPVRHHVSWDHRSRTSLLKVFLV